MSKEGRGRKNIWGRKFTGRKRSRESWQSGLRLVQKKKRNYPVDVVIIGVSFDYRITSTELGKNAVMASGLGLPQRAPFSQRHSNHCSS